MDKKNTIIGVLLIAAAIAAFQFGPKAPAPAPQPAPSTATAAPAEGGKAPTQAVASTSPSNAAFAPVLQVNGSAEIVTLANGFVQVAFTDFGGAIRDVGLSKYPALKGQPAPHLINELHADPILAFTEGSFPGLDRTTRYQIVSKTDREIVFRAVFENRIEVTRRYVLTPGEVDKKQGDPHVIRHETTFRNLTEQTQVLPKAALSMGTTALLDAHDVGTYLNVGYFTGKDYEVIERAALEGGGFFSKAPPIPFIERPASVVWAASKNQFFATIVTPDQPAVGTITRRVEFMPFPGSSRPNVGLAGSIRFDSQTLAPNAEVKLGMNVFIGPKEYQRLANTDVFKQDQDKVMDYSSMFFNRIFLAGYFAPLMNSLINWTHTWVGNWGVAIILATLLIKIVSLPFTLSAAKSAKRMQKLQPLMAAIREKYKDNPQKMQQANMQLFREHKINPLGSCLPVLIPFPFFIGIFAMLSSAPELRFGSFLWVHDLAGPDTVGHVMGFPINILPLILGVVMIVQMKLVPQPSLDTDQAKMMAKMMKWMPLIYVVICYGFSCALALYSTVNGLFTILQQVYINRQKDPEPAVAVAPAGGRGMKNVTPKKKR